MLASARSNTFKGGPASLFLNGNAVVAFFAGAGFAGKDKLTGLGGGFESSTSPSSGLSGRFEGLAPSGEPEALRFSAVGAMGGN